MFLKTMCRVQASEHLDYFRRALWRHFIMFYFIHLFILDEKKTSPALPST